MPNDVSRSSHSTVPGFGQVVPFDSIAEPGTYICNWTGHLLRVPEESLAPGSSPTMSIIGPEPLFVTRISDNAYIPVTQARLLASTLDMAVNF